MSSVTYNRHLLKSPATREPINLNNSSKKVLKTTPCKASSVSKNKLLLDSLFLATAKLHLFVIPATMFPLRQRFNRFTKNHKQKQLLLTHFTAYLRLWAKASLWYNYNIANNPAYNNQAYFLIIPNYKDLPTYHAFIQAVQNDSSSFTCLTLWLDFLHSITVACLDFINELKDMLLDLMASYNLVPDLSSLFNYKTSLTHNALYIQLPLLPSFNPILEHLPAHTTKWFISYGKSLFFKSLLNFPFRHKHLFGKGVIPGLSESSSWDPVSFKIINQALNKAKQLHLRYPPLPDLDNNYKLFISNILLFPLWAHDQHTIFIHLFRSSFKNGHSYTNHNAPLVLVRDNIIFFNNGVAQHPNIQK